MPSRTRSRFSSQRARLMANRSLITLVVYAFALAVGFLAVGFAMVADYAAEWNIDFFEEHTAWALLLPPIVFPLSVWLINRLFWGAGGGGIPQVIKVIRHPKPRLTDRLLGWRAFLGKLILTPLVLASGAAMGREGPTVQIGAAMMGFAHRFPGVARLFDSRSLIIAGGAAGVAAAFNTPLGGLMFAFEELSHKKAMRRTSSLLMAIVLAGLVTLVLQGNYSYFGYSNATIDWSEEWVTILSLGIFAGLIGGLYGRLMIMVVSPKGRIGGLRARHPYWFAAGCGVIVSAMAWVFGAEVLGAGYTETKMALQDEQALSPMYWLVKFTSTLVSFASGAPGGVFSPTLSIGAGFGHFYANLIDHEAAPLMLLAMVGVLSAVTHCPITAFVIVLEMVDNHELVMPLIFVSAVATQVSKRLLPSSIYQLLANHIKVSFAAPVPETPAAATTPAEPTSTADGNKPAGTNQAAGS